MRPLITTRRGSRGAFTLFELLVVVGIILILMIITVPSFASLVKSNNFSGAVNQLAGTLEAARERAIANNRQTAVAVLFDLSTQRCRLLILDEAGRGAMALRPEADSGGQFATVFHPAQNSSPVELPKGVMIFGLSKHHLLPDGDDPYSDLLNGSATYDDRVVSEGRFQDERNVFTTGWYVGGIVPDPDDSTVLVNTWLAPRNDPRVYMDPRLGERDIEPPLRDPSEVPLVALWNLLRTPEPDAPEGLLTTAEDAVAYMRHAQSFMIRFSPEGNVIALSADTTQNDQAGYAFIDFPGNPIATGNGVPPEMVGRAFDAAGRFDPEATPRDQTLVVTVPFPYERAEENPEVALRAASRLAVVDLQDLQRGTGISRPWLVRSALTDPDTQAPWPDVYAPGDVEAIDSDDEAMNTLVIEMSRWIDENAVLIDFSRFSGRLLRR